MDLACGSGSCSITGPSYWTQLRLSDIETFVSDDGTNWDKVDHYELSHEFPTMPEDPDGDENLTKLWLTGIQRLGVSEVTGDGDNYWRTDSLRSRWKARIGLRWSF